MEAPCELSELALRCERLSELELYDLRDLLELGTCGVLSEQELCDLGACKLPSGLALTFDMLRELELRDLCDLRRELLVLRERLPPMVLLLQSELELL